MKGLITSMIAVGALWVAVPDATASTQLPREPTLDTAAQQASDMSSRRRHWRGAHYHRVVVGPRRYRYVAPGFYHRPYYSYRAYNPYFYGYPHTYYAPRYRPWSGYMLGLGIGW
jgi:hypothetical protein